MRKAIIAVALTALAIAGMTAATAFGWHAEGVTVYAECQEGTYTLTASIQGSSDIGEYVKSISPSSLPGSTHGSQSVTVVIGWANSDETQTFITSVYLKGDCETTTPPPPPGPPCPGNPDGQPPNPPGGKDGNPGNDECVPDQPPLTIDTETTPTPPTETTPPATEPPVTTEPPVQETVPPPIVSKNPPHITAPSKKSKPKPPPACPPGQPFNGVCGVEGQG